MSQRSPILGWAVLCLLVIGAEAEGGDERRPPRVYTNDDLSRVSVRNGKEEPPVPASPVPSPAASSSDAHRESHWRAEAERVRRRLEPWRDEVVVLRTDIAARQAEPGVRPYTDPRVRAMQRKLAALEGRIREAEDRLEESARRAGALPGWLR